MGVLDEAVSDVVLRVGEPKGARAFAVALGLETRVIESAAHVLGCEVIASAGNAWFEKPYNAAEAIGCVTFLASGAPLSLWRGLALAVLIDRGLPVTEQNVAYVTASLIARSARLMKESGIFVSPLVAIR